VYLLIKYSLELKKNQQQEVIVLALYKHHQRELLLIKCHFFSKAGRSMSLRTSGDIVFKYIHKIISNTFIIVQ
jgi:hypothetical protein